MVGPRRPVAASVDGMSSVRGRWIARGQVRSVRTLPIARRRGGKIPARCPRRARPSIRPIQVEDAQALARLYRRNRDFLRPFEPERPAGFFTVGGQLERARSAIAAAEHGRLWRFVILDDAQEIAGTISIENVVRGPAQTANLAYWLDRSRGGRGLATEAVGAVVREAFGRFGLHRLEAGTLVDNRASRRVLEKNDFQLIGLARRYLYIGGGWRDHLLFQRLAD
jgi:[ribosomal protein S5]-alanine N-acetyltransferase